MNENDCIVCGKPIIPPKPEMEIGVVVPSKELDVSMKARVHSGCAHRTPAVFAIGYVAHDVRSLAPWLVRLWRLLANPFLYLFTGHVRW